MNFFMRRFNLYLLLLGGGWLAAGCQLADRMNREPAALRVHLQNPETVSAGETVQVLRSQPMLVHIAADPILTEFHVSGAKLVESAGGFAVEIQFNRTGALMLEQYTGANVGRHLAIFGQWGGKLAEGRWLAAPLIGNRTVGGGLTFTPDATREEMERFVAGLNQAAAHARKRLLK